MPAYAVGILTNVDLNDDIRVYLERIDATLQPFRARFIIHGGPCQRREGELPGDLIVIEFPCMEDATRWYASPAYEEIKRLRTENSSGTVFLIDGVPPGHRATDVLS